MTLRRVFFWLHLSGGLVVGLLIAFLALTGVIISFQSQLVAAAERHVYAEHPAGSSCVLPSTLLANAASASPRPLSSVTVFADSTRPAQIATGNEGAVLLVDACTGRILGPGANRLRVSLTAVRELHHQATFAGVRHGTLRTVKNVAALVFVFLTLSGLYLWFPRHLTWQHLRPSVVFRSGLRGRAREWNLHNVVGFWLSIPLFLIAATGTVMAFPWANALLFRVAGEAPPPPRRDAPPTRADRQDSAPPQHHQHTADLGSSAPTAKPFAADSRNLPPSTDAHLAGVPAFTALDAPFARALTFAPGISSVSLRLPAGEAQALTFQLTRYDRQPVLRDALTLAPGNGRVLKWEPLAAASRGRHWRTVVRFLHTGELFGAPGQAVALLSTLGALLLVWTGISLSLRRLGAFRRRKRDQLQATRATTPDTQQPVEVS